MSGDARRDQVQSISAGIRGEVGMLDTRRSFLTMLAAAGTLLIARTESLGGQGKPSSRAPTSDPIKDSDTPGASSEKSPTKTLLEANEKDIKKYIEKLYQLATDLKTEVEKTDSSQVLSLALVKKAEEIEKLAHEIKNRAKG